MSEYTFEPDPYWQDDEYYKDIAMARINAHKKFDLLWCFGHMSRSEAYAWLAKEMDLTLNECHIINFDEEDCVLVEVLVDKYWRELND